jgi:hypothetical protein
MLWEFEGDDLPPLAKSDEGYLGCYSSSGPTLFALGASSVPTTLRGSGGK